LCATTFEYKKRKDIVSPYSGEGGRGKWEGGGGREVR